MEKIVLEGLEGIYLRDLVLKRMCNINDKISKLKTRNDDGLYSAVIDNLELECSVLSSVLSKLSN